MDLKDFVSQTLVQIVEGVVIASTRVSELGGAVSPAFSASNSEKMGTTLDGKSRPVHAVRFDVALTTSSESATEAGGGLRVAVASLGGKARGMDREESTSRIQFSVPLQLPTDPASDAAAVARAAETSRAFLAALRSRSR